MIKISYRNVIFVALASVLLSACQSGQQLVDHIRIKHSNAASVDAMTTIKCTGAIKCEFERIDNIPLIDSQTHRVSKQALDLGSLGLQGSIFSSKNNMYLNVPAKQYEIVVRFYPISEAKAEKFYIIHNFKADKHYTLNMYRDRSNPSKKATLLDVSAPRPLCVALLDGQKVIKRFCRPFDARTGLGEFVEQS